MFQLVIFLYISIVSSSNIAWFKQTSFHDENILTIKNGWTDCSEWSTKSTDESIDEVSIPMLSPLWPTVKLQIPKMNNIKYQFTAKCISLKVPLIWNQHHSNQTINYFISRIYSSLDANNTNENGAFWMLSGGPGGAGSGLYPIAIPWLTFIDSTYDLYIPDHRGTGHSNQLRHCPMNVRHNPSECVESIDAMYGNELHYYSTYSASMDLGYAIDLFTNNLSIYSSNNSIIYGLSYGTYYLNQYLQLFPDQINAAILDGICPPDKCRIIEYDKESNKVGLDFLGLCHEDTFCAEKFDNSIIETLDNLLNATSLTCDLSSSMSDYSMITSEIWKSLLFLTLTDTNTRVFIPPLIYRLNRCNSDDKQTISHLLAIVQRMLQSNASMANAIGENIILSEIWHGLDPTDPGRTLSELLDEDKDYLIRAGMVPNMRIWWDYWNKYEPDPTVYNNYANVSIPMLLLNGDLDPQTHVEWALHSARQYGANMNNVILNGGNKYYYTIPNAAHFVMLQSPIVNYTDHTLELDNDYKTCGFYIMASFIDTSRNFIPDSECINWLTPIDWEGNSNITKQMSLYMLGTADMWGIESTDVLGTEDSKEINWFIIAVVFICLFGIAVCVIIGFMWKLCAATGDGKGKYKATDNEIKPVSDQIEFIETCNLNTEV